MNKQQTNDELTIFLDNITRLRKQHGLTKKEMAKLLKVSIQTIQKIEKGIFPKRLGIQFMIKLYEHFGISLACQLQEPSEQKNNLPSYDERL